MVKAKTIDKACKNMYDSTIPMGILTDMKPMSSIHYNELGWKGARSAWRVLLLAIIKIAYFFLDNHLCFKSRTEPIHTKVH